MNNHNQDTYSIKSRFNGNLISVRGFSCVVENIEIFQHLNFSGDFRSCIVKDLEQELLPQDPGCKIESIVCIAEPDYLTKASMGRNNLINITEYLKITFHLEVIIYSSTDEKWCLKIDLSYARQPSYKKGIKYQVKQDMLITEHKQL